jgi:hypothetical protein
MVAATRPFKSESEVADCRDCIDGWGVYCRMSDMSALKVYQLVSIDIISKLEV